MWMINRGKISKQANKQTNRTKKGNEKFIVWHIYDEMWRTDTSAVSGSNNNKPECLSSMSAATMWKRKNCDVTQQIRSRFSIFTKLQPFQSGEFLFSFHRLCHHFQWTNPFLYFSRCYEIENESHFKLLFHIFVWQIAISFWRIRKTKQQQQIAIWIRITSKYAMLCCFPFFSISLYVFALWKRSLT